MNGFYYNWREIDGYNAPVTVVIGQRGLGKTFGKVLEGCREFYESGVRFVYVVETQEDVKTLSQNKGERFFSAIKEYLETQTSNRQRKFYDFMFGVESEIDDEQDELVDDERNKVIGGTIKINGETAGYIIALNSFGNLKRNNFTNIHLIIIDEFIPEEIDIRHLKMARKVASVVQTVARRKNVRIYMLGNSIRLDDVLLVKLHLDNMKLGEIRKIKDDKGLLVVGHYIDPKQYKEFTKASADSVSGRLATLLGEDNLDKNIFKNDLPKEMELPRKLQRSHLLFCLHGYGESIRINVTQDYSTYYCLSDYGKNTTNRFCFEEKYVTNVIDYRPEWRDVLIEKYKSGCIKFESPTVYLLFKTLLKLEIN